MSTKRISTVPNLTSDSPAHLAAMNDGEDHFRAWQYNVQDHLRGKTVEEIRTILAETAQPFAVLFENWISDFNMSSGVRNANGFNAKEIFYLGDKKVDRRGMVGVQNYSQITWLSSIEELLKLKERYVFVGMDNVSGSVPLTSYAWPKNALMIFGSEGTGLTPTMLGLCQDVVHIPMFGSVRSFNCASSSAMAMYDYLSKLSNESR